jgi:hypothetical protein
LYVICVRWLVPQKGRDRRDRRAPSRASCEAERAISAAARGSWSDVPTTTTIVRDLSTVICLLRHPSRKAATPKECGSWVTGSRTSCFEHYLRWRPHYFRLPVAYSAGGPNDHHHRSFRSLLGLACEDHCRSGRRYPAGGTQPRAVAKAELRPSPFRPGPARPRSASRGLAAWIPCLPRFTRCSVFDVRDRGASSRRRDLTFLLDVTFAGPRHCPPGGARHPRRRRRRDRAGRGDRRGGHSRDPDVIVGV